jgi:hypothetical protein
MRKSLLLFCASLAGFIIVMIGLSEAIHMVPLTARQVARLISLRLFLFVASGVFFCGWALRFLSKPARERIYHLLERISRPIYQLIFSRRVGLSFTLLVFAFTACFSVWYASLGLFPQFPKFGNMYIDQAEAFLHGSTALLLEPSPQLMAMADPFDFKARKDLPHLWDGSLYHGKYYLYWGPVPAMILAAIMSVVGNQVPDPLMVILSVVGILAILLLLLLEIRKRVYPQAPLMSIGLFLLATVINLPYLFILGRAHVYETSIMMGQFFLLLGAAVCFSYTQSRKSGSLFLAGLSWGLAIACRYTLAVSVGIFMAFMLWIIREEVRQWRPFLKKTVSLSLPLAVCLLGLGFYNWVRFDSPFETGLNYQLTTPVYENRHFSAAYLRTNLYVNVLYSYGRVDSFPFIRAVKARAETAPAWVNYHPGKLGDDSIFGLRVIPLFWLLALLLPVTLGLKWVNRSRSVQPQQPIPFGWPHFAWMVGLAGFGQFLLLQFYYYTAVRFMADFYLSWMLVTIFMLWILDQRILGFPLPRTVFWFVIAVVILFSGLLGFLAGFDNPPGVFEQFNPALEAEISAAWNAVYTSPSVLGRAFYYFLMLVL